MKKRPAIEFRLVVDCDDLAASSPMYMKSTKETLCVSSELVADSSNVQFATVEDSHLVGRVLLIILDFQGASKMKSATEGKVKRRIGMLIDGTLFAAPFIREPISDVFNIAMGNLSEDELEIVAATAMAFRTVQ